MYERLWPKKSLDEMTDAERASRWDKNGSHATNKPDPDSSRELEWMNTGMTGSVEDESFVRGYVKLCRELISAKQASVSP